MTYHYRAGTPHSNHTRTLLHSRWKQDEAPSDSTTVRTAIMCNSNLRCFPEKQTGTEEENKQI